MAVSKTDVDASMEENVEIEDIGPEKKGESKGRMDFPDRARNLAVARSAMGKHGYSAIQGIPKKWKGRSGYFFEVISPGEIKITGGDTTETLTGGRSHIMKDPARIARLIEKSRRPGSIVEVGAEYSGELEVDPEASRQRHKDIMEKSSLEQQESGELEVDPEASRQRHEDVIAGEERNLGVLPWATGRAGQKNVAVDLLAQAVDAAKSAGNSKFAGQLSSFLSSLVD